MVELPVINLRLVSSARPDESAWLRDACERLGCFRVSGHRVPAALQADMKAAVCALFDLPEDAKRRNTDTVADSGYIAPNPINPLYESLGLWDAPRDDMVRAPEGLVDADHPRRFKDFNYQDYRKLRRSSEGHTGEALARLAA